MDKKSILAQLQDLYNELRYDGDFEKGLEILTGPLKINNLVNYYINVVTDLDEEDNAIIELVVRILQEVYNNSDIVSPISDENYDKLYELHRDVNGNEIVGAGISNAKNKVISAHKYPDLRGTLDKIHFITNDEKKPGEKRKSLEDWIKSSSNKLGKNLPKDIVIEIIPKWDGISGILECNGSGDVEKALKRGDTDRNEAEEMTSMFKGTNMSEVDRFNVGLPFGVKTEIVMTRENYERLCAKYGDFKSPRSAVSSIINSKELDRKYLEFLTVIPLQVQNYKTKEISTPMQVYADYPSMIGIKLYDFDEIKNWIKILTNMVDEAHGIDIDGMVIRITNPDIRNALGREGNINKFEVAYKLPPQQKKTSINDVEFSVGSLGNVAPTAKIEPVKLKGNKISSISLGSMDRFESLKLSKGDSVIIKYDVIPYLELDPENTNVGERFKSPTDCPYCNKPLVKQPVLRCNNDYCDSRIIGKIENYVEKMSIPNISIGIITTLFKENILGSIESLYKLRDHEREIVALNGFGSKSFQKILDGIDSRKEVYDYELIGSIGIPTIGRKMFKKILDIYNIDELLDISSKNDYKRLTKIGGIKEKTAVKIIEGVNANVELIKFLRSVLTVKRDTRKYTIKVAFSKVRDKEFEKYLDSRDVMVMDKYTKEVDMLIIPSLNESSSKVDKARKDGKEIVSINDAYRMFEYQK